MTARQHALMYVRLDALSVSSHCQEPVRPYYGQIGPDSLLIVRIDCSSPSLIIPAYYRRGAYKVGRVEGQCGGLSSSNVLQRCLELTEE